MVVVALIGRPLSHGLPFQHAQQHYIFHEETRMTQATPINRQFRLAARPVGLPAPGDWQRTDEPLAPLADGDVRVRVQ
jgi:hypothetical protein